MACPNSGPAATPGFLFCATTAMDCSGINGAPIEVFTSDLTGLALPARAEIVLEGFLYPDETFAEGPFGEFTGYYGRPSGATPYMRVKRLRYRDNPTLTCALSPNCPKMPTTRW
jgi:UbiD family decarboxylase